MWLIIIYLCKQNLSYACQPSNDECNNCMVLSSRKLYPIYHGFLFPPNPCFLFYRHFGLSTSLLVVYTGKNNDFHQIGISL